MSDTPSTGWKAGRPRWWAAGLSLCLLVAAGLLAWELTGDRTYVASTPDRPTASVRPALATQTLQDFVRAVRSGDAAAARSLAPSDDPRAANRLAALVHNSRELRVGNFTLRYVDSEGALTPVGDWQAAVDATWKFRGFDRSPARAELLVHLRNDGDRVALTGVGGGGRPSPLWLSGPLQVRRTDQTLVMVAGSASAADRDARHAVAAVPVVRRVLPQWHDGLVVEVPASASALERTLAADPGTYEQIAAVTTTPEGSLAPDAPAHVFINPEVFDRLDPIGAQVVLSHEATHVATGAWDSSSALWLVEGFADYVALRDVDVPIERSAANIIKEVRRSGVPERLPSAVDFGNRSTHLGATYESAWLACRLLAQLGGEDALVAFYRDVDTGTPLAAALQSSFGMTVPAFTQQWQDLLSDLAA